MPTLKLTAHIDGQRSTDLDRTANRCTLITGDEEIAQRIRVTLQQQFGESVYNRNGGTPYLEFRGLDDMSLRAMFVAVVRAVTGVADVTECAVQSTNDAAGNRVATVTGFALSENGTLIPFTATGVR